MDFPDRGTVDALLGDRPIPQFATVEQSPPAPAAPTLSVETRRALDAIPFEDVPPNGTIAVALGSRGITDIVPIARTVIDAIEERGFSPIVVPAMGSHGGATAAGQREVLASLGMDSSTLGAPIEPQMDVTTIGERGGESIRIAEAALEVDGIVLVNRVKPHTNFSGRIESGLCKMAAVGLGKQPGARSFHARAIADGYERVLRETFEIVRDALPLLGGVAIVEDFYDNTARIAGLPARELPAAEEPLLEFAKEQFPTLPFDSLDVLVVDRIGKDISGAGMDPNVTGRYGDPGITTNATPTISRIVVRGLTDATDGNAAGIGVADVITRSVLEAIDLETTYANILTSGSLEKAALPMVMPTDKHALAAALGAIGPYDPETVRIAWIHDTSHLSRFRVSTGLRAEATDAPHCTVGEVEPVITDDGGVKDLEQPDQ